jgi:hypothetical protein
MQWPIKDFRDGLLDDYFRKRGSVISLTKLVPKYGKGARGGGYVTECNNCGTVFFTTALNKHFCDESCRKQYNDRMRGIDHKIHPEKYDKLHRLCNVCNGEFETTGAQIRKGRGLYCSNKCKFEGSFKRKLFFWNYKCIVCGRVFKYSYPYHYCSTECLRKDNQMRMHKDVIVMNIPLLRSKYKKELIAKKDREIDLHGKPDPNPYPHMKLYKTLEKYIEEKPVNGFDDQSVVVDEFKNAGIKPTPVESYEPGESYENFIKLTRWITIDFEDDNIYELPDGSMSYPKTRRRVMHKNKCFEWDYADRRAEYERCKDFKYEGSDDVNNEIESTSNESEPEDIRIGILASGYDYGGFEIPVGSTIDDLRLDGYLKKR